MSILAHNTELLVIVDGECRMCRAFGAAAASRQTPVTRVVSTTSPQLTGLSQLPMLSEALGEDGLADLLAGEDLSATLVVIELRRGGRPVIYRGARAAGRVSALLPGPWRLLSAAMRGPLGALGEQIYPVIARNRHRLGCGDTCAAGQAPRS